MAKFGQNMVKQGCAKQRSLMLSNANINANANVKQSPKQQPEQQPKQKPEHRLKKNSEQQPNQQSKQQPKQRPKQQPNKTTDFFSTKVQNGDNKIEDMTRRSDLLKKNHRI